MVCNILGATAFLWGISAMICSAEETQPYAEGKLIAQIPNLGSLTLELQKEYQGKRSAKLIWLFEDMRGAWNLEDGNIVFHKFPSRAQQPEAKPTLILQPRDDGTWELMEGGILNQSRAQFFSKYPWKSADAKKTTDPGGADAVAFSKAHEQERRFKDHGQLRPLPEDFPFEFMDASTLLFRDREHVIGALLEYPKLSQDVVEIVGNSLLEGEAGEQGIMFVVPVLGANPNLSPRLQEKLFGLPKVPAVWRAVACNPSAAKTYYPEYLKRIREGDKNIRFLVARDQKAPYEAWELAIAPKEPDVLREFSRNKSAPADLLSKVAETVTLTDPVGLAANPATPPEILNQLSKTQVDVYAGLSESERRKDRALLQGKQLNSNDKQILWAIKRNPSSPPEAIERVLRTLATCTAANIRNTCPDDPRLPQDLIEKLSKDPSIQVRIVLSMNPSVPLPILENLAEDPYQMVSERARGNMKKRFPDAWSAHKDSWVPLKELNPNNALSQDIEQAIKSGDVAKTRALLASTDDPDIKPLPATIVSMILQNSFEPFNPLLKEAITEGGPGALETMIINPKLTPDGLQWLVKEHLLDQKMTDRLVLSATENGRTDLLDEANQLGLLKPLSQQLKNAALFTAVAVRSDELVDFWVRNGGDPDAPVREGLSSAGLAAKVRLPNLLKRMDLNGAYENQVAENQREFPPSPKSPLLGMWVNKRNDASTCAFTLGPDGTGVLGTATSSTSILWKMDRSDQITIVAVGPKGPMRDEAMHLKFENDRDILVSDKSTPPISQGLDLSPFYRLKTP